jgi:tellurite resistance protein TerC
MLLVDLRAHRGEQVVSPRAAAWWSLAWVTVAVGFGLVLWARFGGEAAGEYYAGYLIEKSLAVDNVFVFALIFTAFGVPRAYQHRVLFFGVLGALVMRAGVIAAGVALIDRFAWVLYLFGAFLVVTGVQMFRHRGRRSDPREQPLLRLVRRLVPSTTAWHGRRFWVRENGRRLATPLFTVLVLVETTDLIFAVDSIPAIFAVTQDPFLVFTSNAFAILGLRAMYFLLADLVHRFVYLEIGLAAVLVFVGAKMLLLDVYKIPIGVSLTVIAVVIGSAVLASLHRTRSSLPATAEPGPDGPRDRPRLEASRDR